MARNLDSQTTLSKSPYPPHHWGTCSIGEENYTIARSNMQYCTETQSKITLVRVIYSTVGYTLYHKTMTNLVKGSSIEFGKVKSQELTNPDSNATIQCSQIMLAIGADFSYGERQRVIIGSASHISDSLLLATKRSIIWRTNGYKFPNLTAMGDPVGGTYHSLT